MSESQRLRQALTAIRTLRERNAELEAASRAPIAIVAIGCRFPGGVYSPEEFWQLLSDGVDPVRPVPPERWDNDAWFDSDRETPDRLYVREAAFLDQIDQFDAGLFGIAPREAQRMDPQQRILLETAWETFERAGWVPREADDRTGVFIGSMWNEYANRGLQSLGDLDPWVATGAAGCFLGGRLAYHLGLRGPAIPIDTACSSSLVAVHLACESLRRGECDRAIAGGVNVMLGPELTVLMCRLQALSPSGRCKTFDASADGYGRGEGCGLVALKKLSDAERDGDPVLAVIRGSACNHNGTGSGLTVPSADAQRDVIRTALQQADVRPDEIGFVEAHGTGTELGDPIELRALWSVLGMEREHELLVASVKSNIGHLEGAAGIAGLIRTVLCLQHKVVTPHLHLRELNPRIASEKFAIHIPTEAVAWPARPGSRLAGVSSFGLSGVNCHVILGEATAPASSSSQLDAGLRSEWSHGPLVLSAASPVALRELAARYSSVLNASPHADIAEVCVAAAGCRCVLEFRAAVEGDSVEVLCRELEIVAKGEQPATTSDAARSFLAGEQLPRLRAIGALATLPTYRFQRQRYWYEPALNAHQLTKERASTDAGLLYRVVWQPNSTAPKPVDESLLAIVDLRRVQGFDHAMQALLDLSSQVRSELASATAPTNQRFAVVTQSAAPVTDGEAVDPWQSLLFGAVRAGLLEQPQLFAAMVDLGRESSEVCDESLRTLVTAVLVDAEDQIAIRDGQLFVRRLVRASEPQSEKEHASEIRWGGTCLITGGLGAIGLSIALRVAQAGATHLVLVSRRKPDEEALRAISEIEATGCRVVVRSADVADSESVSELFKEIRETLPPLLGIVHAAGTAELTTIDDLTDEHLRRVCSAKVLGAVHLLKFADRDALQRVVLVSSVAGVWGGGRQSAYAGANAFLDGFAAQLRQEGLNALSVDFGPWESGGLSDDRMIDWLSASGLQPISTGRVLDGFDAALIQESDASVVVADVDWPRFLDVFASRRPSSFFDAVRDAEPDERGIDDSASRMEVELSRQELTDLVRACVAEVLAKPVEQVDVERGFFLQGMDSLMAVELRRRLERRLGICLPATLAMDAPRVTDVVAMLQRRGPEAHENLPLTDNGRRKLADNEPIAIVGLGCRFPGANSPDDFWQLLDKGREALSEVPRERWNIDDWFDSDMDVPGRVYTRVGGFVDGIDQFDPHFFEISPREAATLDPQQRLLLEVTWEALEHAGIVPASLRGSRTGVYVGVGANEYEALWPDDGGASIDGWFATGNALNAIAGRVAFTYGFTGPAVAVDTACSSSLVALHQAVQGLRSGDCDAALAAGVNALLRPDSFVAACRARMLSPSGHCHTFSANADGYVRAEGCGVVVLKRLSDARRDGDRVIAVIRGSAVNQDGASGGLTVPHGPSQQRVIEAALRNAGVDAGQVAYVEAHGTGTNLGDPIEVQAAAAALAFDRQPEDTLLIGAVKTNIGHLESAAGIAGVIKVVLAMQHGRIPRQLHFDSPNPHIDWDSLAVKVVSESLDWPDDERQFAGVSGFGFTGTNAHLVLERVATKSVQQDREDLPQTLVISARTEAALLEQMRRYRDWLERHPDTPLCDICETARHGRQRFGHAVMFEVSSVADAVNKLGEFPFGRETSLNSEPTDIDKERGVERGSFTPVALPTYAFQRKRYWIGSPRRQAAVRAARPMLGRRQELADGSIVFSAQVSAEDQLWLNDHKVYGVVVIPGAAWAALVLKAVGVQAELLDVEFEEPVRLANDARWLEVVLLPASTSKGAEQWRFEIRTRPDAASEMETRHAFGSVRSRSSGERDELRTAEWPDTASMRELDPAEMFAEFTTLGLDCGTIYRRSLQRLWLGDREAVGEIAIPPLLADDPSSDPIHPLLLDVCNCVTGAFLAAEQAAERELYIPLGYRRVEWLRSAHDQEVGRLLCWASFVSRTAETQTFDLQLLREAVVADGSVGEPEVLALIEGLTVKRAPRDAFLRMSDAVLPKSSGGRATTKPAESRLLPLLKRIPAANRSRVVLDFVREEFRDVFDEEALPDADAGMIDLGLDSLIGVELRQRLNVAIGEAIPLPATVFFEQPTIADIARHLCELMAEQYAWLSSSDARVDAEFDGATDEMASDTLLDEVLAMSDEEAERALLAELEGEGV